MKKLVILITIVIFYSCEQNQVPEAQLKVAISAEDFKDFLLQGAWQIDKGYINETQVIEAGKSISPLVDFQIDEQISRINFNKDNTVVMEFDAVNQNLNMQYEIGKEAKTLRIFPARGIQDFLQKENWELSNISTENQQFEMVFEETVSGIIVKTRLILKRV